jgi:uncharacterized protein (DUF488 family)
MKTSDHRPLRLPSRAAREQAERKALWNEARSTENADFYTVGYSGRTAKHLVELAKSVGVRTIVDIRLNPVSMYKPEFSKTNFRRIVETDGLLYLHLPNLGVPRHVRARAISTGSRQAIWDWYESRVVPSFRKNLDWFLNIAEHPLAFMCVETDPSECHRHLLFNALEEHRLQGFDL